MKITPRRYRKLFRGKPDHGPTIIRTYNADGTWSDMARPVTPPEGPTTYPPWQPTRLPVEVDMPTLEELDAACARALGIPEGVQQACKPTLAELDADRDREIVDAPPEFIAIHDKNLEATLA